ncbi:carboxylate--amine ligase [Actinomycetospora sp. C-140]
MAVSPAARAAAPGRVDLDRDVPALLLKLGRYPLHHGGLGVVRSLGRAGVAVHAVTEGPRTPVAVSRHLTGRLSWPTTGTEDPAELVDGLLGLARRIGRPSVLVPTDDEAAVVVAESADALGDAFLFPRCDDPGLPRRLASKQGLFEVCRAHGIPTPDAVFPAGRAEVEKYAASGPFPAVVKSRDAFGRRRTPTVRSSTVVRSGAELRALAATWPDAPAVILQEYVPRESAADWFSHAWTDRSSGGRGVTFTGVKVRSWPPHAGMTTYARATWNPELAALTEALVAAVGFAGIADLDWRLDHRDGRYKLLDFNPRVGAQFRLFADAAGVDVVRAQHLALTGRAVPPAPFPEGRRFVVDDLDLAARVAYQDAVPPTVPGPRHTELGWWALDDPLPFLSLAAARLGPAARRLRTATARLRRRGWTA